MLDVNALSFKYKKRQDLFQDLSFNAGGGEFLVIIGPNGAGKSSLLKLLSGTLSPHKGSITWQGKSLKDYKPIELAKQRAVLTQFTNIGFDFSVFDVVLMGRYPHFDNSPSQIDVDIAILAMEMTGVLKYKDAHYQNLSGGEQQRVQLARVIAQIWKTSNESTGLLLLDEPVSSLDLQFQHEVLQIARKLSSNGFCVIAVLHDLNLSLQYADRVMLVNKGDVSLGKPTEVITEDNIRRAFNIESRIISEPTTGKLQVITGIDPSVGMNKPINYARENV